MDSSKESEFYQALIEKNPAYIGQFFVGVTSTGVFCHSICPAKKPKRENCEFFETAKEALISGYRPCKRCRPLSHPSILPPKIQKLVSAVEDNPTKKWKDWDFKQLGIDSSTARRQFKKHFGMTFVEYARLRRLGVAMQDIKRGRKVIDGQLSAGYASDSGFRDSFSKLFGDLPSRSDNLGFLHAKWLDTPIGKMIAIADEEALILLEFTERRALETEIKKLRATFKLPILPSDSPILDSIEHEINAYFDGSLTKFKTPIKLIGTEFQKRVWKTLIGIPFGETASYKEMAKWLDKPTAFRAVANANGKNQLAIIVPCHRVINTGGGLGGYGGGLHRKAWMLQHESKMAQNQ